MPREMTVRISGEAGQGLQSMGAALMKIAARSGLHVFAHQDNMSRIRGGNNFFQLRLGEAPLSAPRERVDLVVALDLASVDRHRPALAHEGRIIGDQARFRLTDAPGDFLDLPLFRLAAQAGGERYVNSVALGAIAALVGVAWDMVDAVVRETYVGKPDDVIESNRKGARAGYEAGAAIECAGRWRLTAGPVTAPCLLTGHDAVALGALRAGCKFYVAYPMSPSTGVMLTLAQYAESHRIVVEQAEDEIAAINMALGASAAGVRAMTGTSGGGFALMVEGVSLSGMTETPVVILDAQRPAPATGFPTRTEQADLDLVVHAGHGEFARAVFAPGSSSEAFAITAHAFDLAEKYQIPVFLLTDQYLAESCGNAPPLDPTAVHPVRHVLSREESARVRDYQRYRLTADGISPRAIPSWIREPVYVDSDEHTECGHITEEAALRVRMVEKRLYRKMEGLRREVLPPVREGADDAEVILVGFGSTYGVLHEIAMSGAVGRVAILHLPQVWPLPVDHLRAAFGSSRRWLTVENNAQAQLARLIRTETGLTASGSILKYDGRPFTLDEVVRRLSEWLEKEE